ncbi:M50 family metallopeptidase [Ammoniphilus sp. CFH 90114]|uniref:M50 family metallopeptidase n=1 Tax=Ammoniphilus sp. CFH 90114 TaxID=2493665 RepID=UPI00100FDE8B|nr:M50 family metallopeptidase [Ammoniphilus sp. CFH 90114]RXT14727.1 stage IV sporulation protein FB [Ammoniphilus sp. CFH 90114]
MTSWTVGGIRIAIHPLFWLVAIAAALTGQFFELITLFTLVMMHELGHVFAALAVGWRVQSMELLPFGGVAKVDEWGTTRVRDEVLVALAGPFVNLVMIPVGYVFYLYGIWGEEWTEFFVFGNVWIAGFNLLPIWPLDGGKILQALLSKVFPFYKTMYVSIIWSSFAACCLIVASFFLPFQWNLVLISFYLILENRLAYKQAQYQFIRFLLKKEQENRKLPSHSKMDTYCLKANERIGEVVKRIKKGSYHCFQVLDTRQNIVASISEDAIIRAFFEKKPGRTISELISIG